MSSIFDGPVSQEDEFVLGLIETPPPQRRLAQSAWQYHRGEWLEIEDPLVGVTGLQDEVLITLGYASWSYFGEWPSERTARLEIYRAEADTVVTRRWRYMAAMEPSGDGSQDVWITDLPSVLGFIKEFAPIIQAQARHRGYEKQNGEKQ